jgi:acyl-CoA thioester hydrolase
MPPSPTAPAAPAPYRHEVRVYWEDTDAGGVVFYANHLKFFERARTEWLRSLGIEQQRLRLETGAIFVVSETRVRYCRPARLDDLLTVSAELRELGRVSMTVVQAARRGDALPAEGDIRIGCVDADSFRPRRIPESILTALAGAGLAPRSSAH